MDEPRRLARVGKLAGVCGEEEVEKKLVEAPNVGLDRLDAGAAVGWAGESRVGAENVAAERMGVVGARLGNLNIVEGCEKTWGQLVVFNAE